MLTPSHFCLADFFLRLLGRLFKKQPTRLERFLFLFGAVAPDSPFIAVGLYEIRKYLMSNSSASYLRWFRMDIINFFLKNDRQEFIGHLYAAVGSHHQAIFLQQCLHSILFWIALAALAWFVRRLRRGVVALSAGAIFFHILIDWPTHTAVAHAYFWPLVLRPISGFVSHDNPWLLRTETVVCIAWLIDAVAQACSKFSGKRKKPAA